MRWILYSRNDCPLCEYAANLLHSLGVVFIERDVDSNPQWLRRYGLCVPVIADEHDARELAFPFEPDDVADFVGCRR